MARSVAARKPTRREFQWLNRLLEETGPPWQQRKAQALVLHAAGLSAQQIAQALGVHPNTIYADLAAFDRLGMASVEQRRPMGPPVRFPASQRARILRLAQTPPAEVGQPYGRWSLATLRAYLIEHRLLASISRESLRQVLKKGASVSGTCNSSCSVRTPSGKPS